jgi:hypothetical protein
VVILSSETPFCRSAGSGGSHKPLALLKLAQPLAYPQRAFINRNVASWRIALKKSFLGDAQNFLEPLMRFARGDVRDLIVSHKIDQGPSYRRHEALQRQARQKISFLRNFRCCSIFDFFNNIGAKRTFTKYRRLLSARFGPR